MPASDASSPTARSGSPAAVLVVFAVAGLVISQALARMPAVRDAVGASTGELGLALVGAGLGSLVAMPFTGALIDRFGNRAVVQVCIVLGATGWGAVGLVDSPWALGVLLLMTGAPFGVWDVGMNVQGSLVEQLRTRSLMPYFHAAFSGGTVVGAGLGALAAYFGIGLVQLPVVASAGLVVGLVAVRRFIPDPASDQHQRSAQRTEPEARGGVTRLEILIGVVCLGGALAEGSA
ncbi:MAG: MFS transporter, partial [Ornithinimicrobium sp.]